MSVPPASLPGLELMAHLGAAVLERAGPAMVRRLGPTPSWWHDVLDGDTLAPDSLGKDGAFGFLAYFLEEAEAAWSEGGARRKRSGLWTEEVGGRTMHFEAEALSFQGRKLLLVHHMGERGEEFEALIQAARSQMLAADRDALAQERLQEETLRAKERAEALSDAKSSLLANVSHEFRTPLGGIVGLADLLGRSDPRPDQVEYLKLIQQSAGSLIEIINDLLDLSKIEVGKVELRPEPFSLRALLAETLGPMAVRAHAKGVELNFRVGPDVPPLCLGDPLRLRQVLVNLSGNAIKFTDEGEVAVVVSVDPDDVTGATLRFSVRDTGPGIPRDRQQQVFEAFTQADLSVAKTHGGTGLGLTISARLVALMGGHLSLASEVGIGTDFHFAIPLSAAPADESPTPIPDAPPSHVIVVDDVVTSRQATREIFEEWGAEEVRTVETLWEAEALLESRPRDWDLLVVSTALPRAPDLESARTLAQTFGPDGLRVLLAFGTEQRTARLTWGGMGVGGSVLKPLGHGRLTHAVDALAGFVPPKRPAVDASNEGTGKRLLLAEDNAVNRLFVGALLRGRGYATEAVADGVSAVRAAAAVDFDAILMDVHMPSLDGLRATRAIRAAEVGTDRRVPIIALTGHAQEGDRERCLAAGMDGYVTKPITPSELYDAIRGVLDDGP